MGNRWFLDSMEVEISFFHLFERVLEKPKLGVAGDSKQQTRLMKTIVVKEQMVNIII